MGQSNGKVSTGAKEPEDNLALDNDIIDWWWRIDWKKKNDDDDDGYDRYDCFDWRNFVENDVDSFEFGKSENAILDKFISEKNLKWIPYDKFDDVEFLGKGGFSTIYKANWLDKYGNREVVFKGSNNLNENLNKFLNEWNYYEKINNNINGLTRNPENETYMVVMDYANKGNLKGNLARIVKYNWKQKLFMLYKVISGLNEIHNQGFIHCNLHDGNILNHRYNNDKEDRIYINYSKLSRPENYILKANDKDTFGVLPFMAPEVIKGKRYTKASDIYSFSMIMWEFTSGTPPFNDSKDARLLQISICNGDRPKIIENTPKCYKDLMEKCWNNDQSRRPTALEVKNVIQKWIFCPNDGKINEELKSDIMEFIKAPIGNNLDVKSINSCTSYNFEKPNEIHEIQSLDEKSNGTREDVKSLDSYVLDGEIDWNS